MSDIPRSIDKLSGLPLYARLNDDGDVIGVQSFERDAPPTGVRFPRGGMCLALFGEDVSFDLVTETRDGPFYQIEPDRVVRTYSVRPKLAAELLAEISWWFGRMNDRKDS